MKKLLNKLFIGNLVLKIKKDVSLAIPKLSLWFVLPLILIGLFTFIIPYDTQILLTIISVIVFIFGLIFNIRYIR
jgi:hypothetical protein